jgi:hypothetical protein
MVLVCHRAWDSLYDAASNPNSATLLATGTALQIELDPGTYVLSVSEWTPDVAGTVTYQLSIGIGESSDNPPPLTTGAAPALQLRLVSSAPPSLPPPPQVLVPPTTGDEPSTSGQSQVIPVSCLTAPGNSQPVSLVLPSGVLLQLGSTPLGGVSSTDMTTGSVGADRVVFQLPESQLPVALLVRGITLIHGPDSTPDVPQNPSTERGEAPSLAGPLTRLQADLLHFLEEELEQFPNLLSLNWKWWDELMNRQPGLGLPFPAETVLPPVVVQGAPSESSQGEPGPQAATEGKPGQTVMQTDVETVESTGTSSLPQVVAWLAAATGVGVAGGLALKKKNTACAAPPPWPGVESPGNADEKP